MLPPNTTSTGGSAGAGGSGTGAGGTAPNTATPTQFGSSASKLGDYLSSNAPQIQQQGANIAGNLNTQYGQVQGDVGSAISGFNQSVQGGYAAPNQDLVNQATTNPIDFVKNPENVTGFQKQLNDQYTGPTNFESTAPYANIQNEVQSAVSNAGLLGSPAGVQSYLNKNNPNETQGLQTLDTALLTGNPEATQQIQAAAKPFAGLTDYLTGQTATANQAVPAAQQAAAQQAAATQAAFMGPTGVVPTFANTINTGASNAEAGRQAYNNSMNAFYSQAVPLEQQINQWAGSIYSAPGINDLVAPLLAANNPVNTPISAANYATPDQYAESSALQQLLGSNANLPLSPLNVSQAGTAPTIPSVNLPTLQQLASQYMPEVQNAYGTSQKAANAVNTSTPGGNQGPGNATFTPTLSLMKYLSSIDPQDYSWNPTGFGFGPQG